MQTLSVLAALCADPSAWRHGYGIAKETGLKSGTLYPILIRLADRGLVEACWEDEQPVGRPRRHLYRLTAEGLASAWAALGDVTSPARAREGTGPQGGRRVAPQVAPWACFVLLFFPLFGAGLGAWRALSIAGRPGQRPGRGGGPAPPAPPPPRPTSGQGRGPHRQQATLRSSHQAIPAAAGAWRAPQDADMAPDHLERIPVGNAPIRR